MLTNSQTSSMVAGSSVVVSETVSSIDCKLLNLEAGRVYRIGSVQIFPEQTVVPREYIEYGVIPDVIRRHTSLPKGIMTTNHDLIGGDRWLQIGKRQFSCAYFRLATAAEVNQHARSIL